MRIDEYSVDIFELDFSYKNIGYFINKFIPLNWIGLGLKILMKQIRFFLIE